MIASQNQNVFRFIPVSYTHLLPGKNDRTGNPVDVGIGLDLVIACNDMQDVQQLALVFMDTFDLDIEK